MLLSKATSYIDGGVCHAWSRPTHQELFDVQYLAQRDMLTKGIEPSDNNTLALSHSHPLPLVCDSTSLLFFVWMYSSSSALISSSLATLSTWAAISAASSSLKSKCCILSFSGCPETCWSDLYSIQMFVADRSNKCTTVWMVHFSCVAWHWVKSDHAVANQPHPCFCCTQSQQQDYAQ